MNPYYQDNHIRIFNKDCRSMSELPDESVQCVVTSPPFWGLRKYAGLPDLVWGDNQCKHEWVEAPPRRIRKETDVVDMESKEATNASAINLPFTNICSLCGAWKGAYGLEPTQEMYIEHTVEILREIRRTLRADGVVFWNIGDSYAAGKGTCFNPGGGKGSFSTHGDRKDAGIYPLDRGNVSTLRSSGLKPKDLCLIPFHVAIEAQRDGWWVRSIIIWSKSNPMPESVKDRPTESHEYILMLTKSGTTQYWTHRDHEGTRIQPKPDYRWVKRSRPKLDVSQFDDDGRTWTTVGLDQPHDFTQILEETAIKPEGWTPKNKMGWDRINLWRGHDYYWDADAVREPHTESTLNRIEYGLNHRHPDNIGVGIPPVHTDKMGDRFANPAGRNIRTVWEFPTQPYPEAHFAVFPEKLPEICIKAATPEVGCCSKCGAPWERVVKHYKTTSAGQPPPDTPQQGAKFLGREQAGEKRYPVRYETAGETLGWQPTCNCNADKVPSIVLDSFGGAGTTPWVAKKLGRRCYVYELSEEYCQLTIERCRQQVLL